MLVTPADNVQIRLSGQFSDIRDLENLIAARPRRHDEHPPGRYRPRSSTATWIRRRRQDALPTARR
ncbi:hypothetical protein ACU4GD_27615 [Cupriavidus basilensis]